MVYQLQQLQFLAVMAQIHFQNLCHGNSSKHLTEIKVDHQVHGFSYYPVNNALTVGLHLV